MGVSVTTKSSLSNMHLRNAKMFRDKAKKIEAIYKNESTNEIPVDDRREHKAFVVSSIYSTISYLEAYSKEFIKGLEDDREKVENNQDPIKYPGLDQEIRKNILHSNPYERIGELSPPIKISKLLELAGKKRFDGSKTPLKELDKFIDVRNELTHFKPRWVQGGHKQYTENEYEFEESIKGEFELNPLIADGNAFFPDQCLSYGCAEWGLRNAESLIQSFERRLDIRN